MMIKRGRWWYVAWLDQPDKSDPNNLTRVLCIAIRGLGYVAFTFPDKPIRWGNNMGVDWKARRNTWLSG